MMNAVKEIKWKFEWRPEGENEKSKELGKRHSRQREKQVKNSRDAVSVDLESSKSEK